MENKLITFSIIFILIIPLFGLKFLIGVIGNILLLIILVPTLLLVIGFLGLNSFKSSIKVCDNCGSAILGNNDNCPYCGYEQMRSSGIVDDNTTDASSKTIEIKAEEIQ